MLRRALPTTFLARLAACALAAAVPLSCGGARDGGADDPPSPASSFRQRTCYRCHGADRSGTEIGPPLESLRTHWDEESLVRYIADPTPFRERDPRIQALVRRYGGRVMRGVAMPTGEARELARWLLRDEPGTAGDR